MLLERLGDGVLGRGGGTDRVAPISCTHMKAGRLVCLKKKGEQNRNRLTDIEKRLGLPSGRGEGVGWTRSLGLVDANYYIYSG